MERMKSEMLGMKFSVADENGNPVTDLIVGDLKLTCDNEGKFSVLLFEFAKANGLLSSREVPDRREG
jgi:hypothetical protein